MIAFAAFLLRLPGAGAAPDASPSRAAADEASVLIDADRLEFERGRNLVHAEGNVTVRRGGEILRADRVRLHTVSRQAHAYGNVEFDRDGFQWRGESFAYNFETRRWAAGEFTAFIDPFRLAAAAAEDIAPDELLMRGATVTTCELTGHRAHYRLRAGRARVRPDHRVLAYNAVLMLGRWPVFYLPVWRASLDPDFGFDFQPGYRGRMGNYLLSSYRYRIDPVLRGRTHLDYRSRRGVAAGQDLRWDDPDGGAYGGEISGYYIDDRDPMRGRDPATPPPDPGRYRLLLRQRNRFSPRDSLLAQLEYSGDPHVREDFFEREYRRAVQPDNFAAFVHRRDNLAFGALARARLNDFYEHIDRLPEITLDYNRRRLGDSPFYYESRSAATRLRRRLPAGADGEDVEVNRIDTRHLLFRPARPFGFLSLIPRAGVRATHYSRTYRTEAVETVETFELADPPAAAAGATNGVAVFETRTLTNMVRRATGGKVRTLAELGLQASFQAARIWETGGHAWGRDLRHVVEPYVNYTLIPEPSLNPDRLHRFDDIDGLAKRHVLDFGVRNILQTRRDRRSHDLLDVNLSGSYLLDAPADRDALGSMGLRALARPADHWGMDLTAAYNPNTAELDELNGRWHYGFARRWRAELDYRYRRERNRLLSGLLAVMPLPDWTFEAQGRYEAETGRVEEHAWYVQRDLDCLALRLGLSHIPSHIRADGSRREDEYRAALEIWLTAFPEARGGFSRSH